ncbi:EthD family reductase [Hydrogenophaga sp. OTU3427]|uniref:EthD family reductase n=1 Tax=Hydrogenophaga sp. OTU3427 TaxID=3043856 RepID=UPI00313BDC8E
MIKFSAMYPNRQGGRFDHAYYENVHLPMVKDKLGAHCLRYEMDKPITTSASPPAYVAVAHIYFESMASFKAGFAPYAAVFQADTTNYTDITPVVQFSEVTVSG